MSGMHEDVLHVPDQHGGTMPVSLAYGDGDAMPVLIIAASVFGYDAGTRALALAYAARGFLVATPDVFWRIDAGPLAVAIDEERTRAFARLATFDFADSFDGFERAIAAVVSRPQSNGRYSVIGICLGGEFAFAAAARLAPEGIATLHGTAIGKHLDEAGDITCPMSLHFGADDEIVPPAEVAAITAAIGDRSTVRIATYDGAGHGFSMPGMPDFNPVAADAAWQAVDRLLEGMGARPAAR